MKNEAREASRLEGFQLDDNRDATVDEMLPEALIVVCFTGLFSKLA